MGMHVVLFCVLLLSFWAVTFGKIKRVAWLVETAHPSQFAVTNETFSRWMWKSLKARKYAKYGIISIRSGGRVGPAEWETKMRANFIVCPECNLCNSDACVHLERRLWTPCFSCSPFYLLAMPFHTLSNFPFESGIFHQHQRKCWEGWWEAVAEEKSQVWNVRSSNILRSLFIYERHNFRWIIACLHKWHSSLTAYVCVDVDVSRWTPTQIVRRILKAVPTMPSTECQIDEAKKSASMWECLTKSLCVCVCLCALFAYAFFNLHFSGSFAEATTTIIIAIISTRSRMILDFSKFIFSLYHDEVSYQMRWKRNLNETKFFAMHIYLSAFTFKFSFILWIVIFVNYYFDGSFELCLKIAYAILSSSFVEIWLRLELNLFCV